MTKTSKCPVCGQYNPYFHYTEWGFGTVERHYYCSRCTYFMEQVYSPACEGISTDCPEEYREKAEMLGLNFYEPEEIP